MKVKCNFIVKTSQESTLYRCVFYIKAENKMLETESDATAIKLVCDYEITSNTVITNNSKYDYDNIIIKYIKQFGLKISEKYETIS